MAAASLLEATRFLSTPHPSSRSRPLPYPPGSGLHPHLLRTPRLSTLRVHLHRPAPLGAQKPARPGALLVIDALRRSVLDSLAALKRPALALLLAGVLLAAASAGGPHAAALAASGGRVGGSAFSSRSSSPRSYGYSAPAPRGGYTAAPFYSPSPFVSVGPALGIGFGGSGFLVTLMGFATFLYLAWTRTRRRRTVPPRGAMEGRPAMARRWGCRWGSTGLGRRQRVRPCRWTWAGWAEAGEEDPDASTTDDTDARGRRAAAGRPARARQWGCRRGSPDRGDDRG
ncbi:hypothetical protein ZEAMMB73_Zm00001d034441 [Zea mays]|uniref:Uncharacterized protein n=2 Tax=Zea mays TaxID=4577 RepID=A0A1D6L7N5_MAIZE|nr:hypothetical protein ZEAMMB73_Zm00001d034441 [Zea mays]